MGKPKMSYLAEGISDYLQRMQHYARVALVEIREPAKPQKMDDEKVMRLEAEKFFPHLKNTDYIVALDRAGERLDSVALADFLQNCMNHNRNPVVFIIGGELGLDKTLLKRADRVLSLSDLTFTHDMTRLILTEQLYRAFSILAGQKYHK